MYQVGLNRLIRCRLGFSQAAGFIRTLKRCCSSTASQKDLFLSSVDNRFKVGQKLHGYTIDKVDIVHEFSIAAVQLTHDKTGAKHLHLARNDDENMFGVMLRTTPGDSRGTPHILEHCTLAGSQNFPCRSVFFNMLQRSLSTFMNAFTGPDFTVYPFSTQNPKDFSNLLSVYLDCVFFPRLDVEDFRQEGWRLEQQDLSDAQSPLQLKGVVFNEMKGVYDQTDQHFGHVLVSHLLPDHTYAHNSGGDPLDIPDLTWDQLKAFHARHYHPSNAKFFTYGSFPLEDHLSFIGNWALKKFDKISATAMVPKQKRWTSPRRVQAACAPNTMAGDSKKTSMCAVSFLLHNPADDAFENFVVSTLCRLLYDGPNSPFYQALIESGMGSSYSPFAGLHNTYRDAIFSIGLKDITAEDADKVEEAINGVIDSVLENGFAEERIEAALHSIEIQNKHQTQNDGFAMMNRMFPSWCHDSDPVLPLGSNGHIKQFKEQLAAEPDYLKNKVRQYFKENNHRLTLLITPEATFVDERNAKEAARLNKMVADLSDKDRQNLLKEGQKLAELQNQTPNVSCLPNIQLEDLDRNVKKTDLLMDNVAGVSIQYCLQPTNGMTYYRHMTSAANLSEHSLMYLPLFCRMITRVGVASRTHRELNLELEQRLGKFSADCHLVPHAVDALSFEQGVCFESNCLDRNVQHMFMLLGEVFTSPSFAETDHITNLVKMQSAKMAEQLVMRGHKRALIEAGSTLSRRGHVLNLYAGFPQYRMLTKIVNSGDVSELQDQLRYFAANLMDISETRLMVNIGAEQKESFDTAAAGFLTDLPGDRTDLPSHIQDSEFQASGQKRVVVIPGLDVSYAADVVYTVPYSHEDQSRLSVLANLLSDHYLHREIREKGGAYGGFATHTGDQFAFLTYRDPTPARSMDVFSEAAEWAGNGKFSDSDLDQAKLTVLGQMDRPIVPEHRGTQQFLYGLSDKMRQLRRDRLFAVTREDIINVARKYILSDSAVHGQVVLGASNPSLESAGFEVVDTSKEQ